MLPEPPPGWTALQEKARRTTDPDELTRIIDEMNQLLEECEASSGDIPAKKPGRNGKRRPAPQKGG